MMSRAALLICVLFASVLLAFAAPAPVSDGELVTLEKRLTRNGRGTWFDVGLGNCGLWNNNNDLIVAIGKGLYDRNGGGNCGQYVQITANGKTAFAMTRDSCPGCDDNDLDMSPALFQKFGSLDLGVLSISWHFMPQGWIL